MAVLGLRFCARAFSSCGKRGPLFIAVRGPLIIAASLAAEHMLQTRRLSNCGSRAQLLRGMWDPPRPGLEPVSPALAGRLSTTAPPGKPPVFISFHSFFFIMFCSSEFHHSVFQVTYPFFLSYSAIDSFYCIFISFIVLFISVCLFFNSSRSLLNISCIFSIFASILFLRSWIMFTSLF